jgi:hypothetical protein
VADCFVSHFSGGATVNWGGVSMDGTTIIGWSGFDIYTMSGLTWTSPSVILTRSGLVWNVAVDSSDDIWWTELNFGSGFNEFYRANLDGSGVTLIDANVFADGHLSYDVANDRFWFIRFGNGLWTMTKAGVENQRYANANFPNWPKISVANDGAAWIAYNTPLLVRVDGSSYAVQSLSSGFTTAQPFYPGCDDDVITKNGTTVNSYRPGITTTDTGCTLTAVNGGGWPIWNGDQTIIYYTLTTSAGFDSWGFVCAFEEDVPPLRLYFRDDARSVGGARQNLTATSIQETPRIRQGAGYL